MAEFEGPKLGSPVVRAWCDASIPFESLNEDAPAMRNELRARIARLSAQPGEILHATYSGPKHRASDVENLLLYNIDAGGTCFRAAAKNGVRFELAECRSEAPSKRAWTCFYQYCLAPVEQSFRFWKATRELAAFHDVHLHTFANRDRLAQTWLAIRRAPVRLAAEPLEPDASFAVTLTLRAPDCDLAKPTLVKSLVDGVVAAFHAHGDRSTVIEMAEKLALAIDVSRDELVHELLSEQRAVLGVRNRLLYRFGRGVKWDPADHLCVAGEVLREPGNGEWAISGRVQEVHTVPAVDARRPLSH